MFLYASEKLLWPGQRKTKCIGVLNILSCIAVIFTFSQPAWSLQQVPVLIDKPKSHDHYLNSTASCARQAAQYKNPSITEFDPAHTKSSEKPKDTLLHLKMPPNKNGTTIVEIGLYITKLTDINERTNTFAFEGYVDLIWCDPRLAFVPENSAMNQKILLGNQVEEKFSKIWWPYITFANRDGQQITDNKKLIIHSDGTLEYEVRVNAALQSHYNMHQFPFDKQQLEIDIESFSWNAKVMQFYQNTEKVGFSSEFELPEWHITGITAKVESIQEVRDRTTFSKFKVIIDVTRKYQYYVFKGLIPIIILVIISWSVFWFTLTRPPRMSISLTTLLTTVAYNWIVTGHLPKVPYLTFLDGILAISYLFIFLTIVENTITEALQTDNKPEAKKIDRMARYLFPCAYCIGLFCVTITYF